MSDIAVHCKHTKMEDVVNLVPHPQNPNKHPDKQIALLAKIIRNSGWRSPIIVSKKTGFIVSGHGRLEAAKLLNVQNVPVDVQEFASDAEEYAHLVADNRIAELSELSDEKLTELLSIIKAEDIDMDITGFDYEALEKLTSEFNAEIDSLPALPDGEDPAIRTASFKVTADQLSTIEIAVKKAKEAGEFGETGNSNSNGNALARIAEAYVSGES
jgi:ParB-like chromosome segregation protein Spo0J